MQYLARHGKVWENKKTGKAYGNAIEIKEPDVIANYTQIPEKEATTVLTEKPKREKEKTPSIFEQEGNY